MRFHHKQWSDSTSTNHILEQTNEPLLLLPFPVVFNKVVYILKQKICRTIILPNFTIK